MLSRAGWLSGVVGVHSTGPEGLLFATRALSAVIGRMLAEGLRPSSAWDCEYGAHGPEGGNACCDCQGAGSSGGSSLKVMG